MATNTILICYKHMLKYNSFLLSRGLFLDMILLHLEAYIFIMIDFIAFILCQSHPKVIMVSAYFESLSLIYIVEMKIFACVIITSY